MKEETNTTSKLILLLICGFWAAFVVFLVERSGKETKVLQIEEDQAKIEMKEEQEVKDFANEDLSPAKRAYFEAIYQQSNFKE